MRLALALLLLGCSGPARDPSERWPGGATTVEEDGALAFSLPARNLAEPRRGPFAVGNNLFADNWVTAPSSTSSRDGLGPRYDAPSCSGCHLHDGRGRIEEDGSVRSAVLRVSGPDGRPDPVLGSQLQRRALLGLPEEGTVTVRFLGDPRGLLVPELTVEPARPGLLTSLRVAPAIVGMGLLEAIDAASIEAREDPADADGDGISGRANRVRDAASGRELLGRFGWKAGQPSVAQQVAAALAGDLGITSGLVPESECAEDDAACRAMPDGGAPEIDDALFAYLVLYSRTLAVPAPRDFEEPAVQRGHRLFREAGCDDCHVPSHVTGDSDLPELAHQRIWPYTDLLLHDLGEGLADGRPEGRASGREWRTPPLWGLGLVRAVNGHDRLLHDGRARGIDEAIRWHAGEADAARVRYEAMPAEDREALARFVGSI